MKKILLIIAIALCIFQLVVLATDIDIGNLAIDRSNYRGVYTLIDLANTANATGWITSIEIWADDNMTDCEVATFYRPDPGNLPSYYSTRDYEYIGAVVAGAKRTFEININVTAGDYIGIYYTAGTIELDSYGYSGVMTVAGDQIPCDMVSFTLLSADAISLYGTGTTEAEEGEEANAIFFGTNF